MTLNLSVPGQNQEDLKPRITVFGVGGAGGTAVNNMIDKALDGVEFVVANTDAQALQQSRSAKRIQMGVKVTEGLGAGARASVGAAAAEESIEEIVDHLAGRDDHSKLLWCLLTLESWLQRCRDERPEVVSLPRCEPVISLAGETSLGAHDYSPITF